ncbi:hypothetical protein CHH55_15820 [Niallia circulans]|uniref:Uncharacterized protein n=2 Tax=Niallia circulans TaxID=1397 RepID=A0A0J1IPS7_NIACI|nr:type II toxin-antitoxin system SpoIISA family toxin [Niallia circulans]KLV27957.1 hypothetical protein ABW02_03425 [Niallia circulans]MDR4314765.1 hypothetical protein [Niallia circulans]MED3841774.1 type II toxin-antitoxin system SpoIISA family toxin [Niallia circulans]MED4242933.1 type II toxin-antitoxin system SpoIISA family toxin [Niallia circulans]MED4246912.1 type II toxin-antitoxin system SpoIISA family toxin [Niallia circulans]
MAAIYFVFITAMILLIVLSLIYFWWRTDKYVENLQAIRKSYYVLFFLLVCLGILTKQLQMADWTMILSLACAAVFIDIAVFQTPDILKIWNTEFQHSNYIRKTIRKNEEVLGYNAKKVQNFTEVISKTADHFMERNLPQHWRQYKDELRTYLNLYADTFQFHIAIFPFAISASAEDLKQNLESAFNSVEICYNISFLDREVKENVIQDLLAGKSIPLKDPESNINNEDLVKNVFIVAYYGESYNMLIGISSQFVEVDGIDASHILNLAQIFDWYMV